MFQHVTTMPEVLKIDLGGGPKNDSFDLGKIQTYLN